MRVFAAVRHSTDPKHFYGGLWSANFYPALRQLGCEIIESQVDLFPASQFMQVPGDFTPEELVLRGRITQRIIDEVKQAHRHAPIDLFLSYFYNSHFDPAGFDVLHHLGVPTVNFYCNSIYQFELVAEIAPKVKYAWHAEKHARDLYLGVGANPVWVQMAADPEVCRPIPGVRRRPKACFVGQRYADRDRWIAALLSAGVEVEIYGSGWARGRCAPASPLTETAVMVDRLGRQHVPAGSLAAFRAEIVRNIRGASLLGGLRRTARQWSYRRKTKDLDPLFLPLAKGPAADIASTFAAYEVVLNFSNVWADGRPGSSLIPHVRLRDFEAPMCRTCYITGYTDEIGEFYELGKELDTYRTETELAEKVQYYLKNPDAAERLRGASRQRALRDHTWKNRFEELFAKTGIG